MESIRARSSAVKQTQATRSERCTNSLRSATGYVRPESCIYWMSRASEYAVAVMKAAKESGNAWLNAAKGDADKSGMGGVKNDGGTGGGAGKQDEFMDAIKSMGKKQ